MSNLKHSFEKIHARFEQKKDYFKQRIELWRQKGKLEDYQKVFALFSEAEREASQLRSAFQMPAQGNLDEKTLRSKIKAFKSKYQELNELTKPIWRQWAESFVFVLGLVFVLRSVVFSLYAVPSGSAEPAILVGDKIWANKMIYFFQKPQRGEFVTFDNPEFNFGDSGMVQRFWQKYVGVGLPFLGLKAGPENVVKRVIAIPGDTIEGRVEDGKPVIYLNNKKLDEPYVNQYPLIRVRRIKGFIDSDFLNQFKFLETLGLLRTIDSHFQVCTYDPSKSLADQPYYQLNPDEVVKNPVTDEPLSVPPHTPGQADTFGPLTVPEGKYWVMGDSRNNSYDSRFWSFLDESLIRGRASFVILSIDTSETLFIYDLIKHPIDFWTKHIRWNCFLKGLGEYYGRPDLKE